MVSSEGRIGLHSSRPQGLTYLLQATGDGNYQSTPINLNFTHKLAKVRVKLEGTKADEVTAVTVRSYPTSTHSHGTLDGQDKSLTPQYVPMRRATYGGVLDANNSFQVANADGVRVQVTQDRVDIKAGHVHTVTIRVGDAKPVTTDISDNGTYIVSGTREESVNITGGNPTIYLKDANITASSGNAINITNNATPTIYVVGENNTISSGNGAGIYVAQGSTVNITGSSRDAKLTVRGGSGSSGIGGYIKSDHNSVSCGDITISNITVSVYGSAIGYTGDISPGIGCSGNATCGTIAISSATVHAFGITDIYNSYSVPGIGTGITMVVHPKNLPDVIAFNSEIYAYRGNPGGTCDYIGWAADLNYPPNTTANSAINPGTGGSIKSSTVYCYTGDTLDKTVEYDENGGGKEQ